MTKLGIGHRKILVEKFKKSFFWILGGAFSLFLQVGPGWLPENTPNELFNNGVAFSKRAFSYQAPVLVVLAIVFFIIGAYLFVRRQELHEKYEIRDTLCHVRAPDRSAVHSSGKIITTVRCSKDNALFEYHSGRDHAEYACLVCGLQLSPKEHQKCKREAEGKFVSKYS